MQNLKFHPRMSFFARAFLMSKFMRAAFLLFKSQLFSFCLDHFGWAREKKIMIAYFFSSSSLHQFNASHKLLSIQFLTWILILNWKGDGDLIYFWDSYPKILCYFAFSIRIFFSVLLEGNKQTHHRRALDSLSAMKCIAKFIYLTFTFAR